MKYQSLVKATLWAFLCCALSLLTAYAGLTGWLGTGGDVAVQNPNFKPVEKTVSGQLYRIGSGDVLKLDVFGRPEVSVVRTVGPDGKITVPVLGDIFLNELARDEALSVIEKHLQKFFTYPQATLEVQEYKSSRITVLGRVERAGTQQFSYSPTLAEVLASAGAMPILDKQATLTRCAIMRGRDKLIWVDLKSLLNGDPALTQIGLCRAGSNQMEFINFSDLIKVERRGNYAIEDGDVIFVGKSTLAKMRYFMRQLSPIMSVLTFGITANTLGK